MDQRPTAPSEAATPIKPAVPSAPAGPGDWNQQIIEEFRSNGGRVGGMFAGANLLLLTTIGARTGRPHTTPVGYLRDGVRLLAFASNAGLPHNPNWYHNLLAHPMITVEIGAGDQSIETFVARATSLRDPERARFYRLQAELIPAYGEYQTRTSRIIPVVALERPDFADAERNQAIAAELLRVHADLRDELARIRVEADAHQTSPPSPPSSQSPSTPSDLGLQLRQHCLAFCDALHLHHTNEDGAFPSFEKQFPALAPTLDRLRAEHHVVAESLAELRTILTDLAAGTGEADALRKRLEHLAEELEAHFTHEEEQLVRALTEGQPSG
nr:nitroreductase/quinone reductase family protein [Actinopolymorpha pittospori]